VQIHLIEDLDTADRSTGINTQSRHAAFSVDDINAMEARLREHGIPYIRKAIPERGWPQIFFQDPDGHTIEIGTYGVQDR
jgi:catechol 2,3-dioxygenase-like lactoylglutathione lyase family enzyme